MLDVELVDALIKAIANGDGCGPTRAPLMARLVEKDTTIARLTAEADFAAVQLRRANEHVDALLKAAEVADAETQIMRTTLTAIDAQAQAIKAAHTRWYMDGHGTAHETMRTIDEHALAIHDACRRALGPTATSASSTVTATHAAAAPGGRSRASPTRSVLDAPPPTRARRVVARCPR